MKESQKDRDLRNLLLYLSHHLVDIDKVRAFLYSPGEAYFGMTPIEFMASCGEKGPSLVLDILFVESTQKARLAA